jgi:hypothetical protein
MMKILGVLGVLISIVGIAGCATILSGSSTDIQIDSAPSSAEVVIKSSSGLIMFEGTTPTTVKLSRKNEYQVTVSLSGYKMRTVAISHTGIQSTAFCNLFSLVGWGVDYLTGAMNKLEPNMINVTLKTAMVDNEPALFAIITMLDENGDPHGASVIMEKE